MLYLLFITSTEMEIMNGVNGTNTKEKLQTLFCRRGTEIDYELFRFNLICNRPQHESDIKWAFNIDWNLILDFDEKNTTAGSFCESFKNNVTK